MTAGRRRSDLWGPAAIAVMLALLGVLGLLQYRWAGELGTAHGARLRQEARSHAEAMGREFDLEVTRAFIGLQAGGDALGEGDFTRYAERYQGWRRSATFPSLVKDILLVEPVGEEIGLSRYVPERGVFEPAEWTAELDPVHDRLEVLARGAGRLVRGLPGSGYGGGPTEAPDSGPPPRPPGPILEEVPALVLFGFERDGPRPERHLEVRRDEDGSGLPPARRRAVETPAVWTIRFSARPFLVVILDLQVIREQVLPELARRHFAGPDGEEHDLVVVRRQEPAHVVWSSRPDMVPAAADAAAFLFDLRFEELSTDGRRFPGARAYGAEAGRWRLLVSHRGGPLEQVVARTRRRNLALGFGTLVLLGASVALVVVASRRAQRLGERQMDFVAAVSHELRTPVSAICGAAENLADGVVADPAQVREYGAVIHGEGRRLAGMVERVLEFARTTRAPAAGPPEDVPAAALLQDALRPFEPELRDRGFDVVQEAAPWLVLRGDAFALRRALQNLVENALKYDTGGRWLAVRAQPGPSDREVRLTVEDHGGGIAAQDLPRVFDPFFRGQKARAAQVRGFGLGLAFVRRVVEAHGGRLTVTSVPGRGTTFTLDLPAAPPTAASGATSEHALANPDR